MSTSMLALNAKTTSIDYVTVLLQYAQQHGIEAEQLLTAANIDAKILEQSSSYISTEQYQALVETAIQLLQQPSLALALGQHQHLATHGALGYAIMSASSIEQALNLVTRFIRTRSHLIRFNFFFADDYAVTQIDVRHPMDHLYKHCVEIAFSCIVSICHSLTQKQQQPCLIKVKYAQPSYHETYENMFLTAGQFNAPINELRIPLSWFEGVSLIGNPVFAELAQKQCEELLLSLENQNSLSEQVQAILRHSAAYMPNQQETATQLGLSSRSLSRQLAAEGNSFKQILEQHKQTLAKEYLLRDDSSIENIAYLLAYESPPNFSRAFKRWTGLTPQQFRLENKN